MKTNPAQKPLPKWWDPDRIALLLPKLKARNQILSVIKDWFRKEGFIEVVPCSGVFGLCLLLLPDDAPSDDIYII